MLLNATFFEKLNLGFVPKKQIKKDKGRQGCLPYRLFSFQVAAFLC
jgi:hypothetical protein